MVEKWKGEAIAKMHVYGITQTVLAVHLGVTREYVNKILNGKRRGNKDQIMSAINELAGKVKETK